MDVEVNELKEEVEVEGEADEELGAKIKEKLGVLMGGRASNERKWRDVQTAFANILKVRASTQG